MTRDDVIELMGEPTAEFDASEATAQSQWDAGEFDYTTFYDASGHVDQAQVDGLEDGEQPFPRERTRFFRDKAHLFDY